MRRRAVLLTVVSVLVLYTAVLASRLTPRASGPMLGALTAAGFAAMLSWLLAYHAHPGLSDRAWFRAAAWAGAVVMGLWATFVLVSLPVGALASLRGGLTPGGWLSVLGAAVLASAAGLAQALAGPRVREVSVAVPDLPPALEGLRVAQISDLHVGLAIRRAQVEEMVRRVLDLKPDLIAVTGDLADGDAARLASEIAPLSRLKAPLGAYFVTGNHEYYWGVNPWLDAVRGLGLRVLLDESVTLSRGGASLQLAGVCDPQGRYFEPSHAGELPQADASAGARVLLAHRPDCAPAAAAAGYHLQLSGHTHGGQFFPFNLIVRLAHRHLSGLSREGAMSVYVNTGTGWWGPPHRFGVPAEITLLKLTRG
jgi:predicted MPP superfamily phosphohydrolase